jgi:predicted GNAT family acetyltransferase
MFDLINSIQPGYYNIDTPLLGRYYGIRRQGRLIAMAGERMRIPGFSELSAICTDPAHTGHGYAQRLIVHLCQALRAATTTPFLHVALSNQRAISLYEHLGFQHRREISFWRCRKA